MNIGNTFAGICQKSTTAQQEKQVKQEKRLKSVKLNDKPIDR